VPGGKEVDIELGFGSSAFASRSKRGEVRFLTDRGPTFYCEDSAAYAGRTLCAQGVIFLIPDFAPRIVEASYDASGEFRIGREIPLVDPAGRPLSGVPPVVAGLRIEQGYTTDGSPLPADPDGIDTESLVALSDGSFWVGEEYLSSLLRVGPDGRVIERLVPAGLGELPGKPKRVPIRELLPSILLTRTPNRSLEALALSRDEKKLWFLSETALSNPDRSVAANSLTVRLFRLDLTRLVVDGEWAVRLDPPESLDPTRPGLVADIRISDATMTPDGRLVILERSRETARLLEIDVAAATNLLGSSWDDRATRPTLEELAELPPSVRPVSTRLLTEFPLAGEKIEALGALEDGSFVLANDSDFGIEGKKTRPRTIRVP
jgi:hypothetical protein